MGISRWKLQFLFIISEERIFWSEVHTGSIKYLEIKVENNHDGINSISLPLSD
jgi:hypothetical protein